MHKLLFSMLMLFALVFSKNKCFADDHYDFFTASNGYTGTWTCPAGVNSITVFCWSAGGAGGSALGPLVSGGGGGGGTFAMKVITVVPGTVYTYNIGQGGQPTASATAAFGGDGGDSWFGSTTTVLAKGGKGGQNGTTAISAGSGGTSSTINNIADLSFVGGAGAKGNPATGFSFGGGGGGSAGQNGNGFNATNRLGGEGGDGNGSYGGDGAGGFSAFGQPGSDKGSGGGASFNNSSSTATTSKLGAAGGDGYIFLLYPIPLLIDIESFTGNKTDKGNELHLVLNTTNEKNIEVSLEKSTEGKTWTAIQLQKVGNESTRHTIDFVDNNLNAPVHQYRIKVMTDGNMHYSNVIVLNNERNTAAMIKMIPNPSVNESVLNIQSLTAANATIVVTSITGKTMLTQKANLQPGNNNIELNLSSLAMGNYQITVINTQGNNTTTRFVKQ